MLSSPETNIAYGNEQAWEYNNTHLMGENDKKACLHVLKGEARKLARLGTDGIRIGSEGSKELCSLLCNSNLYVFLDYLSTNEPKSQANPIRIV